MDIILAKNKIIDPVIIVFEDASPKIKHSKNSIMFNIVYDSMNMLIKQIAGLQLQDISVLLKLTEFNYIHVIQNLIMHLENIPWIKTMTVYFCMRILPKFRK